MQKPANSVPFHTACPEDRPPYKESCAEAAGSPAYALSAMRVLSSFLPCSKQSTNLEYLKIYRNVGKIEF